MKTLAPTLFVLLAASPASAAEPPADSPPSEASDAPRAIDRTWLYADDARVAAPMQLVATSSLSYTSVGSAATREGAPFPYTYNAFQGNTAQPGGMVAVGGELGLLPRLSVVALGQMGLGGEGPSPNAGAIAGLRFDLAPSSWKDVHLVASGGYLREAWQGPTYDDDANKWYPANANGANGAWAKVAIAADVGRARLAGAVNGEHVFSDGRDPIDVMVVAGASYRVAGPLRAGVEWVGQDLEESFSPGAEGGARHFVGPDVAMQLLNDRFTLVAGPSIGLSPTSPRLLGRLAIAYGF